MGIGGAATFLALLLVAVPLYTQTAEERDLLSFLSNPMTVFFLAVAGVFVLSSFFDTVIARVAQTLMLIAFGVVTLALADAGSLTGIAVAGVGIILAAHYGFFQTSATPKIALTVISVLGGLLAQAIREAADLSPTYTALEFAYNSIGVLGLTLAYALVLRDAASAAAQRQAELEQAVRDRTAELTKEVEARKVAETDSRRSAEAARALAAERLELLREVHHRAKNSLQMTLTLLEAFDPKSPYDKPATVSRVRAIGLVYDLIDESEDLSAIRLEEYLQNLLSYIQMGYSMMPLQVVYESQDAEHRTRLEPTINLGLMIHEMIHIAQVHVFGGEPGLIRIVQNSTEETITLHVQYNGTPLPEAVDPDIGRTDAIGLLPAFAERLHARVALDREHGNDWSVEIPKSSIVRT
jgi:two-component sensor histidine kinase